MVKKTKLISVVLVAFVVLFIGCNSNTDWNSDEDVGQEFSVKVSGSNSGAYYFSTGSSHISKGYVKENGDVCSKKEGDDIVGKFKFKNGTLYISIYKDKVPRTNHNMYVFDKNHNHVGNAWFEYVEEQYLLYYKKV